MGTTEPFIGIDFGTSKSCMAWVKPNGEAEVLRNAEGEDKTPSVVYFGEGDEVLVGSPAEAMLEDEADRWRVVRSVKRDLVSAPTLSLPGRKRVKPVEVAAAILCKLRLDAERGHFHQPVLKAVITCPAEFGALEREAIAKAGKLAGFEEVALLEEPVAAGLAYQRAGLAVGDHVLVYDLGGGTFDLAVLMRDAEQGYRLALEPQGETRCGGDDFDRALYDYCDQVVEETLGRSIAPDGKVDPDFLRECREAKEALTAQAQVRVNTYLAAEDRPVRFKHMLERAVFEDLVRERVDTTVRLTQTLLQRAQASGVAVDTVVLIGGSARVPLVIQQLEAALPVAPQFWEKQDLAVALGAAYHAQRLWDNASEPVNPVVQTTGVSPKPQATAEIGEQASVEARPPTIPTTGEEAARVQEGIAWLRALASGVLVNRNDAVSLEKSKSEPFFMPVEDVFSIKGRGTVVTGRIHRGTVRVGDTIEIVGLKETRSAVVECVEMFRKILQEGVAGEPVGCLLRGIARKDVERGQVLVKPGSVSPHRRFQCEVFMIPKGHGGRDTAFRNGYRPHFRFFTIEVSGEVKLPTEIGEVMPGALATLEVKLVVPLVFRVGDGFAVREDGNTVGTGLVTRIIE